MSNINYGIDLGTTNSLIAHFSNGKVEVYKNPVGLKETLPSVVAFRNERILIGDKAREYMDKDPGNVFGGFKRKMGTDESFLIHSLEKTISPIELSAIVLRELKKFIQTGDQPESIVITIPASFDTIQSNATKKAGYEAGFKEVVLLQEPIAASLAYVNKGELDERGKWLVYDLGGGTFDVALVSVTDEDMRVIDHEGDNFLGGLDFDDRVVDKIFIPALQQKGIFKDLHTELRSRKSKYNRDYYRMLKIAEETKIQLSVRDEVDVELEVTDDQEKPVELFLTVTRQMFEAAVSDLIEDSLRFITKILERNDLQAKDLREIILVGGSTYIPYVRRRLAEYTGIAVNSGIDPTSAVAAGAAYYAGNKRKKLEETPASSVRQAAAAPSTLPFTIKSTYSRVSRDPSELFFALISGLTKGYYYRITRKDGGYDSGIKALSNEINESLPLVQGSNNGFSFFILDKDQNRIPHPDEEIEIIQGKYQISGQPLPHDICLEIDDPHNGGTRLEVIFEKNSLLPLKKTLTRSISKSIAKGSDDILTINVVEGSKYSSPDACLSIGQIEISGKQLSRDLVRGSDVELVFEISESRDILISAYLMMTDQEYNDAFSPSARKVKIHSLLREIQNLSIRIKNDLEDANYSEEYELAAELMPLKEEIEILNARLSLISDDDSSDVRYQVDEKKRSIAGRYHTVVRQKKIVVVKKDYFEEKNYCKSVVDGTGKEEYQQSFQAIIANEKEFLAHNNELIIKNKIKKFRELNWLINQNDPDYITALYLSIAMRPIEEFDNQRMAEELMQRGEKALERKNISELKALMNQLYSLLPESRRTDMKLPGTGLS